MRIARIEAFQVQWRPEDLPSGETMRLGPYFIHWQRAEARSAAGSLMGSGVRLPSGATHFQSRSGQIGVMLKPAKVEIMPGSRTAIQVELFNEATLVDHLTGRAPGQVDPPALDFAAATATVVMDFTTTTAVRLMATAAIAGMATAVVPTHGSLQAIASRNTRPKGSHNEGMAKT